MTDNVVINSDDVFIVYLYGTFKDTWGPENATLDFTIDCGSHCEEYGHVPGDPKGETNRFDLCEFSQGLEQPLGGRKKNETCPPEPGPAMIPYAGFVWPFPFHVAVSRFLSLSRAALGHLSLLGGHHRNCYWSG